MVTARGRVRERMRDRGLLRVNSWITMSIEGLCCCFLWESFTVPSCYTTDHHRVGMRKGERCCAQTTCAACMSVGIVSLWGWFPLCVYVFTLQSDAPCVCACAPCKMLWKTARQQPAEVMWSDFSCHHQSLWRSTRSRSLWPSALHPASQKHIYSSDFKGIKVSEVNLRCLKLAEEEATHTLTHRHLKQKKSF